MTRSRITNLVSASTLALTLCALSTAALAATPAPTTREERMSAALQTYRDRNPNSMSSSNMSNSSAGPVERSGNAIKRGAKRAGHAIKHGVEKTGEVIGKGVRKTGDALHRGGEKLEQKSAPAN